MKKITSIFAVVLTLALLLGAVVGVSASADETSASAAEKWVISANVSYSDDIHPYFAVDANLVDDASLLSVTVDGKETVISEAPVQIKAGVYAYVVEAEGVVAKNFGKALSIVVSYNGKVVEETSYSVAEYFYERLYKNDFINKFNGEDFLRRELYISTLEYGAAAQAIFAPTSPLVTELLYVVAPDYAGMWDASAVYAVKDEIAKVTAYAYAGATPSVIYVAEGTYNIGAAVVIEAVNVSLYQTSDKVLDFEGFEATDDFAYSADKFAGENSTVNHYNGASSGVTPPVEMGQQIVVEDGNTYFKATKTGGPSSNGQTWLNTKRTDTSNVGNEFMFEAKFRIEYLRYTDGKVNVAAYLRVYKNGTDTKGNDGTVYGGSGSARNLTFRYDSKASGFIVDDIKIDATVSEWFTLRLIFRNADKGIEIDVYSNDENGYLKYRGTCKKTEWTQFSVGEITNVVYMNDTTTWLNVDIDDIYLGAPIDGDMQYPKLQSNITVLK